MKKIKLISNTLRGVLAPTFRVICVLIALCSTLGLTVAYAAPDDDLRQEFSIDGLRKTSPIGTAIADIKQAETEVKNLEGQKSIGINTLYGTGVRSFVYSGEVPDTGQYQDYPKMAKKWFSGNYRTWSQNPTAISEGISWSDDKTNDIHAKNLSGDKNTVGEALGNFVGSFFFSICAGLNALVGYIVNFAIQLGNLDINWLLKALELDKLSSFVAEVVIGTPPSYSPILLFALCAFLGSLLIVAVRMAKSGTASLMKVVQSLGIFVLAIVLVYASLPNGKGSNAWADLSTSLSKTSSILASQISGASNESFKLFEYRSENQVTDVNNTQNALTTKPFIDTMIVSNLGYPIEELNLWGDGKTQENWGISEGDMKNLVKGLTTRDWEGYEGEETLFAISCGATSNKDCPNLGYYWYCANAGVDTQEPIKDGKIVPGDSSSLLFIPDLLSAIDAKAKGSVKAQKIMENLSRNDTNPGGMFLCLLVSLALLFAMTVAVAFSLYGKVMFHVGLLLMPFVAVVLLIPNKGLSMAKQFVMTWFSSFAKMLVGTSFITLMLFISGMLCSVGYLGMFLDIVVLAAMGIFSPKLFAKVNEVTGRGQLPFASNIDSKFNGLAKKTRVLDFASSRRKKVKNERQQLKNENNALGRETFINDSDQSSNIKVDNIQEQRRERQFRQNAIDELKDELKDEISPANQKGSNNAKPKKEKPPVMIVPDNPYAELQQALSEQQSQENNEERKGAESSSPRPKFTASQTSSQHSQVVDKDKLQAEVDRLESSAQKKMKRANRQVANIDGWDTNKALSMMVELEGIEINDSLLVAAKSRSETIKEVNKAKEALQEATKNAERRARTRKAGALGYVPLVGTLSARANKTSVAWRKRKLKKAKKRLEKKTEQLKNEDHFISFENPLDGTYVEKSALDAIGDFKNIEKNIAISKANSEIAAIDKAIHDKKKILKNAPDPIIIQRGGGSRRRPQEEQKPKPQKEQSPEREERQGPKPHEEQKSGSSNSQNERKKDNKKTSGSKGRQKSSGTSGTQRGKREDTPLKDEPKEKDLKPPAVERKAQNPLDPSPSTSKKRERNESFVDFKAFRSEVFEKQTPSSEMHQEKQKETPVNRIAKLLNKEKGTDE